MVVSTTDRGSSGRRFKHEKVGYQVILIIVWLALEYGRPPNPMKVPFMISLALLAGWVLLGRKRWNPQLVVFLLFVGQMILSIPFAENNYSAMMVTREVFTVVLCIALPMAHFIDTPGRFDAVMRSWVGMFAYMAAIALMNGGNGPGGGRAGVDENYTALFLSIGISFALAMVTITRSGLGKLSLLFTAGMCVLAIVVGSSRGGFVALMAVAAYCWWQSPHKVPALAAGVLLVAIVLAVAPAEYWDDMRSITDTSEGTAELRITFWKIAFQIYLDNPIIGIGPGNFPWVSGFYQEVDRGGAALGMNVTHSFYFELLAEMGTSGVIMIATIIYFNMKDLRLVLRVEGQQHRILRHRKGTGPSAREIFHLRRFGHMRAYASGLIGGFIGFFVASAFLSTLYYTTFWLLTGLTVALREVALAEVRNFRAVPEPVGEQLPVIDQGRISRQLPSDSLSSLIGR